MNRKSLLVCLLFIICIFVAACSKDEGSDTLKDTEASVAATDEKVNDGEKTSETADLPEGLVYNTGLQPLEAESMLDTVPDRAIKVRRGVIKPYHTLDMDGNEIGDEFYFYRSTLSDNYRMAYDFICNKIASREMDFELGYEVNKDDFMELYTCIYYDHPEFFWLEHGFSWWYNQDGIVTHLYTRYNNLGDDIDGNQAKIDAAVEGALTEASKLKTQAEQVKYIHDYLKDTITYELNAENNQCIFSSLVNKRTVCAGYSRALQYCLQKLHIPVAYICGYPSNGGYHAWNMLKLAGDYYMMDVTWDDQIPGLPEKYYYDYFNITEEQLSKERSREELSAKLPDAKGTKYCYEWFKSEHPDEEPDSLVGMYAVKTVIEDEKTELQDESEGIIEDENTVSDENENVVEADKTSTDEVKTDDSKTDEVKTDDSKTDEVKTDDSKTDEVKTDDGKTDEVKTDDSKSDEVKTDDKKTDEVKTDDKKTDEVKTDDSKSDEVKTDDKKTDKVKTDDSKTDEVKTDDKKTDEVKTDDKKTDEVKTDDKKTDEVKTDDNQKKDDKTDLDNKQSKEDKSDKEDNSNNDYYDDWNWDDWNYDDSDWNWDDDDWNWDDWGWY